MQDHHDVVGGGGCESEGRNSLDSDASNGSDAKDGGGGGVTNAAWVLLPDNIPSRWTRFKGSTALLWLLLSHGLVEDNDGTGSETQRLNPDTGATPRQRELL